MRTTLVAFAIVLLARPVGAVCAPEKLVRIVMRASYEDLPADHFAQRPKTLLRLTEKYGRIEEEPNPETGLHLLLVINEPDVWVAYRGSGKGRHTVDSGPVHRFVAPVLQGHGSPFWDEFEFGCEIAFLEEKGAEKVVLSHRGETRYRLAAAGVSVDLYADPEGRPSKVEVESEESSFSIHYLAYETGLPPDLTLFEKPQGFDYEEIAE